MEKIEIGFQTFLPGKEEEFGAVRAISRDGQELVVYVENAGDFKVSIGAVKSVQSEKVVLDPKKLDSALRAAIGHAHEAERF
jgi:hypothetical protein